MEENKAVSVEDMTDYLVDTYKEYSKKSKKLFMKSVSKAYEWNCYLEKKNQKDDSSEVTIINSFNNDIDVPTQEVKRNVNDSNKTLIKMYKSPVSSLQKLQHRRENDVVFEGDSGRDKSVSKRKMPKEEKQAIRLKRRKFLALTDSKIAFHNIAGFDFLEEKIRNLMYNLVCPGLIQPVEKSFLITGPLGSGKSSFVHALAQICGQVPVFSVVATELVAGVSGETENRIKELFEQAIDSCPCILHIQRIDAIVPSENSTKGLERRIASQLISCLSDLKERHSDKQILVSGETNHSETLEWELKNSFDKEIVIPVPSQESRCAILKLLCQEMPDIDFCELSLRTPGFVAGDLKRVVEKSQSLAWERHINQDISHEVGASLSDRLLRFYDRIKVLDKTSTPVVFPNMNTFMEAIKYITPVLKKEGFPSVPSETWESIGGLEHVKQELKKKLIEPIKYAKLHEEFGARRPSGILLWGPPGCGKTLLAKAVANEASINLLPVMGPEILSMYQGESERGLRQVFSKARNVAPCVIFFDEFDSLCPVRSKGSESGSKSTIVNTLLTEMNGFGDREEVYVIAATNRLDVLDPAVTRPGRFDTLIFVDLPDNGTRVSIFKACTKSGTHPKLAPDVSFEKLAEKSENFSGADCSHLVYLASKAAITEIITDAQNNLLDTDKIISWKHFEEAFSEITPSVSVNEHRRYQRQLPK